MNRLEALAAGLVVFMSVPSLVRRAEILPPRWRLRLGFFSLMGMTITAAALLSAVILPVEMGSGARPLWERCIEAFRAIRGDPFGSFPSLVAGSALAFLLGRFLWSVYDGLRTTRRAQILWGEPRWRLWGGTPAYVLAVDPPEAYSVGFRGRQVVVSRGLLEVLDEEEREAVLLHEEGHLRGRHHVALLLGRAAAAALAPLPSARVSLILVEQAAEEAADDYAASRSDPATVASGLSKGALAGLRNPLGQLSLGSGPDVPARVRRLLNATPAPAARWVWVCGVLTLGLLLTVLTATQMIACLTAVAAVHHLLGLGAAVTCPLFR